MLLWFVKNQSSVIYMSDPPGRRELVSYRYIYLFFITRQQAES